jgi:hypothetical protein
MGCRRQAGHGSAGWRAHDQDGEECDDIDIKESDEDLIRETGGVQ